MKWIRKIFGIPDNKAIEHIRRLRAEAEKSLDEIEAALDGEERWFLEHYDSEQPPTCECDRKLEGEE